MNKWTGYTSGEIAALLAYWHSFGYDPYNSYDGHPRINRSAT